MKTTMSCLLLVALSSAGMCQVDTSFIYNTNKPYGTLDIRIRKSSSRYYYLQTDRTHSFRENSPGVKTNTYRDMTSWDSSPYTQGNLREKNGTADYFVMNYRLLFPVNYNPTYDPGYPIVVMMHGLGERGNCWDTKCYHATRSYSVNANEPPAPTTKDHQLLNNDHNLLHGGKAHLDARNAAGSLLPDDPSMPSKAFPGFVLFPQNLNGWTGSTVQDAIRLVRLIIKKYKIDPNRVYIHGLSNGAIATYDAIKRAPWLFAAALPMSAPSDASINSQKLASSIVSIPLWIFQGGLDTAPSPSKTETYIKLFREAGLHVRYSKYDHLGHGVWNTAYREPDFFKWMLAQNKRNIRVFADVPKICKTNGKGVVLSLAAGFYKYQWQRDGTVISGATGAVYVATTPGTYRARFSRVPNPTSSQWNPWSDAVKVTEQSPAQAKMQQIGTVLLKDLNGYGNARFRAEGNFAHYYWYKDGKLVNLDGSQDDTVKHPIIKPGDCSSGVCTGNGKYTLVVAGYDNCPSPPSASRSVYFNNQAPINLSAPTSFKGAVLSSTSVKVTWTDASSGELGFEIWRRKVTGSSSYTPWTMPVLTGANASSFTDTGLEPSSTYHYKIRAAGKDGRSNYTPSSSTSYLVVTTSGDNVAPTAPTNLTAKQTAVRAITLQWKASTDDSGIREYVIYYGTTSVNTGSASTSYTLKNLPLNRTFTFTVKAKDLAGNMSAASNSATANTYVEGLYYEHSTGAWSSLDAINWNTAEFTGKVSNFTLAPRTQEDYFNFRFDGYLYINTGGTYYFNTTSSDGSRVELDGVVVVDNNGVHGTKTVSGPAHTVNSGPRRIIVKYFEYDGSHNLTVRYRGPDTGGTWQVIPTSALRSSSGTTSSSTGVEAVIAAEELNAEETLSVYPNPTSRFDVNIQLTSASEGEINVSVLDLQGRRHYAGNFGHHEIMQGITIGGGQTLSEGIYILVVQEKDRTTKRRIVITK
jgi:hypothetical protein